MAEKRYYWIQLREGFFKQKEIKKLRKVAGGDTYTVIYLKMLLAAVKQGNKLYFEGVEETFPEELALELDEDPENVKITLAFLERQGLVRVMGEDEFLLLQCEEMVGSESESASRVRRYREKKALQSNTDVTPLLQSGNTDIDKEKDKEKDTEKDKNINICPEPDSGPEEPPVITLPLNTGEEYLIFQRDVDVFAELYPAVDVLQAMRGMKGWLLMNPTKRKTKRGIGRFINSWLAREQDKGGKQPVGNNARDMTMEQYLESIRGWNE
ncbi:MAG: hypothetical protein HFI89_06310 [Lachnospiraceae bacterium]|nr:hypothetical protein [Lachnospiraceae bacterium]